MIFHFLLFQILTNGRYKSVEHRGMLGGACERLSLATFYSPSMDAVIAPAADLVDESHPCRYEPTLFADYIASFYKRGLAGKNYVNRRRLVKSKWQRRKTFLPTLMQLLVTKLLYMPTPQQWCVKFRQVKLVCMDPSEGIDIVVM